MLSVDEERTLLEQLAECSKVWDMPVVDRHSWELRRDAIMAYAKIYEQLRDNNAYPLWNPRTGKYEAVFCPSHKHTLVQHLREEDGKEQQGERKALHLQ